jgi:hypothetical protein
MPLENPHVCSSHSRRNDYLLFDLIQFSCLVDMEYFLKTDQHIVKVENIEDDELLGVEVANLRQTDDQRGTLQ